MSDEHRRLGVGFDMTSALASWYTASLMLEAILHINDANFWRTPSS